MPQTLIDLVVVDLGEDDVLLEAERVVAAAVEALRTDAAEVACTRGSAMVTSRSRNSYMRSPRSVTLAPIGMFSRILKVAIDLRARVMTGFWPAISVRSLAAAVDLLAVVDRLADAHVEDDLFEPRHLHRVLVAELLDQLARARPSRSAPSCAACSPWDAASGSGRA